METHVTSGHFSRLSKKQTLLYNWARSRLQDDTLYMSSWLCCRDQRNAGWCDSAEVFHLTLANIYFFSLCRLKKQHVFMWIFWLSSWLRSHEAAYCCVCAAVLPKLPSSRGNKNDPVRLKLNLHKLTSIFSGSDLSNANTDYICNANAKGFVTVWQTLPCSWWNVMPEWFDLASSQRVTSSQQT